MLGTGSEDAQEAGAGSEKGRKDVCDITRLFLRECFCSQIRFVLRENIFLLEKIIIGIFIIVSA